MSIAEASTTLAGTSVMASLTNVTFVSSSMKFAVVPTPGQLASSVESEFSTTTFDAPGPSPQPVSVQLLDEYRRLTITLDTPPSDKVLPSQG